MRLSPPTFRWHDDASHHHDNDNDDGKSVHRDQSLVSAVPKTPACGLDRTPGTAKSLPSKTAAFVTKNAMLRFVARVLIARQHGLCRAGAEAITICTPVFAKVGTRKGRLSPRSELAAAQARPLSICSQRCGRLSMALAESQMAGARSGLMMMESISRAPMSRLGGDIVGERPG
jgi:hypothetical protein